MKNKVCVVGAGNWGKNHINSLLHLGSLGGIVESKKQLRKSFANSHPHIKVYEHLSEALEADYDGFIIATPAETHFSLAKKVIISGKHVLVEKPMSLSIVDAKELVDLAHQYNVNLMVGHVLLFHPAIIKIKEMIDRGDIGKLQYMYSNRLNLGKIRTEENVFWSLAPHDIAIFQYFTDSYPKKIQTSGSNFIQEGIHDSTITYLEYENGMEGHIFVSWLHPFKEHRLVVIGSEAMISFEDSLDGKPLKLYSKKYDLNSGVPEKIDGPVELIPYNQKMPLIAELEYFIEHLNGKKLPTADMKNGLNVVRILVEASKQLIN